MRELHPDRNQSRSRCRVPGEAWRGRLRQDESAQQRDGQGPLIECAVVELGQVEFRSHAGLVVLAQGEPIVQADVR